MKRIQFLHLSVILACALMGFGFFVHKKAPQASLPAGHYKLELRQGDDVVLVAGQLSVSGSVLSFKSTDPLIDLQLRGFMDGDLFMAYAADYEGGMVLRGGIGEKEVFGDGVWNQTSESPVFIKFTLRWNDKQPVANSVVSIDFEAGEMTDPRDKEIYKTISLGGQTWMAENLRFKTPTGVIEHKTADIKAHGRYYNWAAANTACPKGWHLPTADEWALLLKNIGGGSKAGKALKSTTGWKNEGNGDNTSGMNVLPSGFFGPNTRSFDMFESEAVFWTASDYFTHDAYLFVISFSSNKVEKSTKEKSFANSCRCIKD